MIILLCVTGEEADAAYAGDDFDVEWTGDNHKKVTVCICLYSI